MQTIDQRLEQQHKLIELSLQRCLTSHEQSMEAPEIPQSPAFRPGNELAEIAGHWHVAVEAEPEKSVLQAAHDAVMGKREQKDGTVLPPLPEYATEESGRSEGSRYASLRAQSHKHLKPARQDSYEQAKKEDWVRSEMSDGHVHQTQEEQEGYSIYQYLIARLVRSWQFETFFALLIFAHAILLGVQIDWECHNLNKDLPPEMANIHVIFTSFFLLEIILRILGFGARDYFMGQSYVWNLIDVFLVPWLRSGWCYGWNIWHKDNFTWNFLKSMT